MEPLAPALAPSHRPSARTQPLERDPPEPLAQCPQELARMKAGETKTEDLGPIFKVETSKEAEHPLTSSDTSDAAAPIAPTPATPPAPLARATPTATPAKSSGGTVPDAPDLLYGFSECIDNERALYYYMENATTCTSPGVDPSKLSFKPPVTGLKCDIPCPKGTYLGVNFTNSDPVSACLPCNDGTFSLGGGMLFSKLANSWTTPLPVDIFTECVTRNMYTNQWQSNCAPWVASADGTMITSGSNSDILDRYEASRLFSTLRISATFVREGSVTFQFYVDAEEPYDGLFFQVDDKEVMPTISKTDGWTEAMFEIKPGSHSLSWQFTKDFSGDHGEDRAFIKIIELEGTSYADTYCHPCGNELTSTGGMMCAYCDENQYAAASSESELQFRCYLCPKGMFAPKGSIGVESCILRRACTMDDVVMTATDCIQGRHQVSYDWSKPRRCDASMVESLTLPKPMDLPCDACNSGYFLAENGTCITCPTGQFYDITNTCVKCPDDQVTIKQLDFGIDSFDAWRKWPSVVDVHAAKDNGWTLTQTSLALVPQSSIGAHIGGAKRFPLLFNVTFESSGFFNLTYELANMPIASDDHPGAWLELQVQETFQAVSSGSYDIDVEELLAAEEEERDERDQSDSIVHLKHGKENGTFSELVPISVVGKTTKQFSLVVRTSGLLAERQIQVKILRMSFRGTVDGGNVGCTTCAPGYHPFTDTDDAMKYGCRMCSAGSYSKTSDGRTKCSDCPPNTFSRGGASSCTACGNNSFSAAGSSSCAAPLVVQVNYSASEDAASEATQVRYNLSLLQTLVWGNDTALKLSAGNLSEKLVDGTPVIPNRGHQLDDTHTMFVGVLRPIDAGWRDAVFGMIVEDYVVDDIDHPYIIMLDVLNPKDAGGYFMQASGLYGNVQCSVPPQWAATNGGTKLDIQPLSNGTGVVVSYLNGGPCPSGGKASTKINFICDVTASLSTSPELVGRDSQRCAVELNWKTQFACPICTEEFFQQLRTECNAGTRSISYSNAMACYGGFQPDDVPIQTCSDIVLAADQLTKVYAAAAIVGFVLLVLFIAVLVIYRKYRNTYNEYQYLKSTIPKVKTKTDGSKESTFEFSDDSTSISSPIASVGGGGFGNAQEGEVRDSEPVDDDKKGLRSV
ncbi:TPA: hypothetical protein N0F65_000393 [Lagenidium giganteum]|uniref:MRH domain-containing protein n=1 Tax=Lagenidium giganteum TaxID=4803 RepID=A0AAV2Z3R6_9STRA|nr:TPA: hypothetical protein N0F65_000393 [Lagenidium giganteum]